MRREPISDPEGDRILGQEAADRDLQRSDSPRIHLGPLEPCRECGYPAREVSPGHWTCPCDGWQVAA